MERTAMNVIHRTPTRLVLQEHPWPEWMVGLVFVVAGGYVALGEGELLFGGAFAALGMVALVPFGNTVRCVFDRDAGTFVRETRGPLGSRCMEHALKEITGVRVTQGRGRGRTFRVELTRAGAARIPLTSAHSSGKQEKEEIARVIRTFLGLPDPGELSIPRVRDLLEMVVGEAEPRTTP